MGEQPVQVVAEADEEEGLRVEHSVRTQLGRRVVRTQRRKILLCMAGGLILVALTMYLLADIIRNYPPNQQPPPSPAQESLANSPALAQEEEM
jgi:hypothetical protein